MSPPTTAPSATSPASADTRREIALALELLVGKREVRPAKKHGLGPA